MDPNEALRMLRQLVSRINAAEVETKYFAIATSSVRLADMFEALDSHLSAGGALPDAWARAGLGG